MCYVIFLGFVDLDCRVLGVDLAFDEALECGGCPDVEADLPTDRGDFETQVLLYSPTPFELFCVAQDTMQTGEKLFCGEFGFVVCFWDFEDEQRAIDDLDLLDFAVVPHGEPTQDETYRNPYVWG